MNRYKWEGRYFVLPFILILLPVFLDRDFKPKDFWRPTKEGFKLFLLVTAAVILLYPPLFFGFLIKARGAVFVVPTAGEIFGGVLKGLLAIAVAAIPEEFFFRCYIQEHILADQNKKFLGPVTRKNLITSLLFGLIHVLAFLNITRMNTFFPSLLFGLFTEKSRGRIFYSIAFHAVSNILQFTLWTFIE
ncbi:CPBP family intramembrane metalloprotease [bacterium]|nr:CPBP family intramembrane metalloprotease [bacterium]